MQRSGARELAPLFDAHLETFALADAEFHHLGDGFAVGLEPGFGLPSDDQPSAQFVQRCVGGGLAAVAIRVGLFREQLHQAGLHEPRLGFGIFLFGDRVQKVAVDFLDARVVQATHQRQHADLVGRQLDVGRAEDERLVALVAATVEQRRRLGVGARDDDAGHAHHVELEARRVEPLDLLVLRDEHLAALVAALLGSRALVLDVVAGDAGLDEAADQVAHVRVAAVAGVGIGDDERPEVDLRRPCALGLGHAAPQVLLVAIGSQQRSHQRRAFRGHLAERITGQIRARVLGIRALGRGRPAAEVDALDAHALHRHGLARRVRPERRDAPSGVEKFAQARVERAGRLARDRVIVGDGAALFDDLACIVKPRNVVEAWAVHPPLRVSNGLFLLGFGLGRHGLVSRKSGFRLRRGSGVRVQG